MNTRTVAIALATLGTLSCAGKDPVQEPVIRPVTTTNPPAPHTPPPTNPPPPELQPPLDYEETGELPNKGLPKGEPGWDSGFDVEMNARTADNDLIFRGYKGCYIELDYPEPPSSWEPPPTQTIPCPPQMGDVRWTQCREGRIQAKADLSECSCVVDGNPPPPPAYVHCPDKPSKR